MKIIKDVKERVPKMVFFGILFVLIGQFTTNFPDFYYKHLDKTNYYQFTVPMRLEKYEYCACSQVRAYADRNSLINAEASVIRELVLINASGQSEEIYYDDIKISINEGEERIPFFFNLPCDVNDGDYFYRGTITFRVHDVEKSYYFYTETFRVIN